MQNRWIVVVLDENAVHAVFPYKSLKRAKTNANQFYDEKYDVVVWDLALDRAIYIPSQGVDLYPDS